MMCLWFNQFQLVTTRNISILKGCARSSSKRWWAIVRKAGPLGRHGREVVAWSVSPPPQQRSGRNRAVFSFLYLKKLKFQKYMSVLENFKNIPRSPYGGRQGSNVIFFSLNLQRSPWRKKKKRGACRPPNGRQAPVAHRSGDQPGGPAYRRKGGRAPILRATGGPVAPPLAGDQVRSPLYKASPLIPSSFDLKKSRKKRGVERREAAKLCRIPHLWSTGNFRINALILYNNLI